VSSAFLEGIERNEVRFQACLDCGAAQTLARCGCKQCGGSHLEWRAASGRGKVHAITVVSRAPSQELRALAPYTIVLVDLEEGARLMGHGEADMAIGDHVEAGFFEFGGRKLIRFRRRAS
jgi:hypothetical protein